MWPAVEAGHERGQQHPSEHVEEEQRGAAHGVRLDGTCVKTRATGRIQSGLQPNPMFQAHRGMDELFKWSSQVCKLVGVVQLHRREVTQNWNQRAGAELTLQNVGSARGPECSRRRDGHDWQ